MVSEANIKKISSERTVRNTITLILLNRKLRKTSTRPQVKPVGVLSTFEVVQSNWKTNAIDSFSIGKELRRYWREKMHWNFTYKIKNHCGDKRESFSRNSCVSNCWSSLKKCVRHFTIVEAHANRQKTSMKTIWHLQKSSFFSLSLSFSLIFASKWNKEKSKSHHDEHEICWKWRKVARQIATKADLFISCWWIFYLVFPSFEFIRTLVIRLKR